MNETLNFDLTSQQNAVIQAPLDSKIFLEGPAGGGKTTTGVARMLHLLASGIPANQMLVLVPQRTLATPYYEARVHPTLTAGGQVEIATVGGLARRMVDLFWPLVVEQAGFGIPDARPTFLTLETAQYYMARIVNPLAEKQGYFESINIDRNRLYSQILDNLNKAAVVGFPPTEIAERLKSAWVGEPAQVRIYDEAQACALRFRRYCLEHNLLDFSLQLEVFTTHLWPEPLCRDYVQQSYTHLIVDNIEEDSPVAHDLMYTWLPHTTSAMIIYDQGGGYRSFLGADPKSGHALVDLCEQHVVFDASLVTSPDMAALGQLLSHTLAPPPKKSDTAKAPPPPAHHTGNFLPALRFETHHYHPEMLDWVADEIHALVHDEGIPEREIVVLAPFLTDALRFSLSQRLTERKIQVRSHRPSRALRDEPATHTLLTLAALAHPQWRIVPTRYDVAYALMHSIGELDLVRAQLLADVLYRSRDNTPTLLSFDGVNADMQQRITYVFGGRYEALRMWLLAYRQDGPTELDHFLARLFGEILSQPGYHFHRDLDAAKVAATLVESVQKFRWIAQDLPEGKPLGKEYLDMVRSGVIAAQYVWRWQQPEEAVLLTPAYTFLLRNQPVDVQFWINVGGTGWWERLYQPLTHPYVLSRRWPQGQLWTDTDEVKTRQRALHRLAVGLTRRCRKFIYLGLSDLGEQGYEQQGPLLKALQRMLRQAKQ